MICMEIALALSLGFILGGLFCLVYLKTGEKALAFSDPGKRKIFLALVTPLRYLVLGGLLAAFFRLYPETGVFLVPGLFAGNLAFRLIYLRRELKYGNSR